MLFPKIDDTIRVSAGNSNTDEGTGGMITKLLAAEIVTGFWWIDGAGRRI